ncbi:S8 family serine peptidase [Streptomyces sp. WMMC940]|uniref:S8 family serine peptidase n=1 Tax=Streptomyces sp. WMMC940 TaxID=3015153 RepID=UPI0022B6ADF4|nr:S8 family serine peptidase [Streptomyces sp. WMMC940]MCZ7457651.1 S8 family serine peptidase [Streptomyces sp. WMMC940]
MAAVVALTAGFVSTAPTAFAADAQSKQWYLEAMNAEEIWKTSTGKGITVAVIDTGVDPSTPSLRGQVLKGKDVAEAKGDETDDYTGHGTTMAELIVGTGAGGGLKGLAPGAKVIPYRVSDTELQNKEKVNAFDEEEAIRAAADSEARIINISFGSEYYASPVREAVKYAQSKGKLLFSSSGNLGAGNNKASYPAAYPEAIAVGATDRNGEVADYSTHGDFVDIAAPGSDIPGYCNEKLKDYCPKGGTSAASAIASASAALIWSAHPEWTANQVLRVMFESAGRGEDWKEGTVSNYLGHGIVRPGAHINRGVGKPGAPDISPLTNTKVGGPAGGAPSSASSAPSAPASSQAPKGGPESGTSVASSSKSDGGGGQLGLIIGIGAAVVIAAGAFAVIRKRRTT